jgi:spore germination protein YaaH
LADGGAAANVDAGPNQASPQRPDDAGGPVTSSDGATQGGAKPSDGGPASTDSGTGSGPATGIGTHRRCGWIASWEGYSSFVAHAAEFDAIHPKWHVMLPDGVSLRAAGRPNDAAIRAAARQHGVRVIPLVDTDTDRVRLRLMLSTAAKRSAHIAQLLAVLDDNGYDGLDIDYEGLWSASDRAGYVAFLTELSAGMRQRGKELTVASPALAYDSGGYSYAAMVPLVDTIHLMGYDYHSTDSHQGPLAPLGWLEAVFRHAASTGRPERFILGVANYAVGSGFYTDAILAPGLCTGPIETTTDHMSGCSFGKEAPGRAPHCNTASVGPIWFEDLPSMEEKLAAARRGGLRGVTYWTLGGELPGYFDLARRYFP